MGKHACLTRKRDKKTKPLKRERVSVPKGATTFVKQWINDIIFTLIEWYLIGINYPFRLIIEMGKTLKMLLKDKCLFRRGSNTFWNFCNEKKLKNILANLISKFLRLTCSLTIFFLINKNFLLVMNARHCDWIIIAALDSLLYFNSLNN